MRPHRKKALLDRLAAWLEEWPDEEELPAGIDPALARAGAEEERPPDLAGLTAAVLARRRDLQIQGKAFKRIADLLEEAPPGDRPPPPSLLSDLLDLSDRISRCLQEGRRSREGLPFLARLGGARGPLQEILEGVALVGERLDGILRDQGLAPLESTGLPFDPNRMVAVGQLPAEPGQEEGMVRETVKRGYAAGGSVVRPAQVRVTRTEGRNNHD